MTTVLYKEKSYQFPLFTTCKQVIDEIGINGTPETIVGLKVNGIVQSLHSVIDCDDCTVEPAHINSVEGKNMCRRVELLLLRYAMYKLYPTIQMNLINVYADSNEYELSNQLTEEQLNNLTKEFNDLHSKVVSIKKLSHKFLMKHFTETKQFHSQSLIESLNFSSYNCAMIDNFAVLTLDQPFLTLPSLLLESSKIKIIDNHLMIFYSEKLYSDSYSFEQKPKVTIPFETNKEVDVGFINKSLVNETYVEIMKKSEKHHADQLNLLLEKINEKKCKLILIAGPSSSGKTTFAHKVALGLKSNGLKPLVLSVDNYYVHRDNCPLTPEGKRDWECIDSLRLSLLNEHLLELMEGKEVLVPHFDFVTSTPIPEKGKKVQLEENGVIIMEGIHCLNEKLTEKIPSERKIKIFICPLSHSLCLSDDLILNNDTLRIQRRMVRDKIFRGYTPKKTMNDWNNVAGAESTWIYPFIKDADFVYSTFISTEVNVLRQFSVNYMKGIDDSNPCYGFAQSYIRLLSFYHTMDSHHFVGNSIIREFIGNGDFDCH